MNIITQHKLIFFFGGLFFISLAMYWFDLINANLFLGFIGSIATLYFGALKLKIENDTFFKALFISFNDRYGKDLNDLLNVLRSEPEKVLDISEINKITDYFNLCAEEFLWYKKGRIPQDVWNAWKAGIVDNLAITSVRNLWLLETSTENKRASYYGLHVELNK